MQVITAGKPFQGNQLQPHMLTTAQGKQVLQASQGGKYSMHPASRELSSLENWKYLYWKKRKSPGISLQK